MKFSVFKYRLFRRVRVRLSIIISQALGFASHDCGNSELSAKCTCALRERDLRDLKRELLSSD